MTEPAQRDLRWTLVLSIYLLWAVSGIMQTVSPPPVLLLWLNAFLTASVVTTWCAIDARRRGKPILHVLHMVLFFTWPLGAPVYLIWSRGWRGLGLAVGHAVALIFTTFLAINVASLLGHRLAQ